MVTAKRRKFEKSRMSRWRRCLFLSNCRRVGKNVKLECFSNEIQSSHQKMGLRFASRSGIDRRSLRLPRFGWMKSPFLMNELFHTHTVVFKICMSSPKLLIIIIISISVILYAVTAVLTFPLSTLRKGQGM